MFGGTDTEQERTTGIGPVALLRPNELLRNAELAVAGLGYLEWNRYVAAAELHRQVVEPFENTTMSSRAVDPFAICAARLAAAQQMTQTGAEHHLSRALALRDRLPKVALLLKNGLVAPHHIAAIVSRTDLVDRSDHMTEIDNDIADHLSRRGSWSKNRLRDMVDATIFRRDPDLVRRDRDDAKKKRGVSADNIGDGMAAIDAVSSAEETAMIMARLDKLATSVCSRDPRRKSDRMADALFAVVMGREFYCQCPDDDAHPCTADIVVMYKEAIPLGINAKIVLHVIADQATVDGTAENPGFLEGHGVISADHIRDIAARPETVTRTLGNATGPADRGSPSAYPADDESPGTAGPAPDSRTVSFRAPHDIPLGGDPESREQATPPFPQAIPLPVVQPGDPYRPSRALDSFLRIRDCYCMWPGCDRKAWDADLDHTCEYNHRDPDSGGHTHPSEMKTLCRFHHLLKTYSDWLDDQYPDSRTGRTAIVFTTPEGRSYEGPAWTGDDLFPALARVIWDPGRTRQRTSPPPPSTPDRQQTRTEAKHARRRQERERNRRDMEAGGLTPW